MLQADEAEAERSRVAVSPKKKNRRGSWKRKREARIRNPKSGSEGGAGGVQNKKKARRGRSRRGRGRRQRQTNDKGSGGEWGRIWQRQWAEAERRGREERHRDRSSAQRQGSPMLLAMQGQEDWAATACAELFGVFAAGRWRTRCESVKARERVREQAPGRVVQVCVRVCRERSFHEGRSSVRGGGWRECERERERESRTAREGLALPSHSLPRTRRRRPSTARSRVGGRAVAPRFP